MSVLKLSLLFVGIVGAATLKKWRIKLNLEDDKAEVDPKVAKLQLI